MKASRSAPTLFSAESFAKRFGRRTLLSAASYWVWPRRVTALIGRNGCGKSTLLKLSTGLVRGRSGTVIFGGYRTTRPSLADLAHRGLFYWPDLDLLPRGRTVLELLASVRHHQPDADIDGAIDTAQIGDTLRQTTRTLSGGERRRVELALVLARAPRCVLADEPFRGVVPADRALFATAFRQLTGRGCGILTTGHEVEDLLALADHVVWMTGGTTHYLGTPLQARRHDQFCREYLGAQADRRSG